MSDRIFAVEDSQTIQAAGDYAANDVVANAAGDLWEFDFSGISGGRGLIFEAALLCDAGACTGVFELYLFKDRPTASTYADNGAISIADADLTKALTKIEFPALKSLTASAAIFATNLTKYIEGDASGIAYGILVASSAIANEAAGMVITIRLTGYPG